MRVCAIRYVSRREQTGCNGDSRAAPVPTRMRLKGGACKLSVMATYRLVPMTDDRLDTVSGAARAVWLAAAHHCLAVGVQRVVDDPLRLVLRHDAIYLDPGTRDPFHTVLL